MTSPLTVHHAIYTKLEQLGLDFTNLPNYAKSLVSGFMDLNMDLLYTEGEAVVIALSHYFEQNGDMVADPDMQLRVLPALEMAEALTYQDQWCYREVYPKPGYVDPRAKQELDTFLDYWLSNCLSQGHSFARGSR